MTSLQSDEPQSAAEEDEDEESKAGGQVCVVVTGSIAQYITGPGTPRRARSPHQGAAVHVHACVTPRQMDAIDSEFFAL